MKRINHIIPEAMNALLASNLVSEDRKSIPKEYDGYVASFAPSVITAGLRATLSFYTDRHKSTPKRIKVLKVIHTIYQNTYNRLAGDDLLTISLNAGDPKVLRQLRQDLIDCSIALKLVMRNFEQKES